MYRTLTKSLCSSEEGSGEDKGAIPAPRSHYLTFGRCLVSKHTVNVVDISVLPTTVVFAVLVHGDLRAVEDTWLRKRETERERLYQYQQKRCWYNLYLIHIVPSKQVFSGAL